MLQREGEKEGDALIYYIEDDEGKRMKRACCIEKARKEKDS